MASGSLFWGMMGLSWRSAKYVDEDWRKRAGPRLWPSVLYYIGIVDGSPEAEKVEKEEDEGPVYVPYEEKEVEKNDTPKGGIVIPEDDLADDNRFFSIAVSL